MTRQDFEMIAAALAETRPTDDQFFSTRHYEAAATTWQRTRDDLIDRMIDRFPQFDVENFLFACQAPRS